MKTLYSHGKTFTSCTFCDQELTLDKPGMRIAYIIGNVRYVEHTCKHCFDDPDYQETIRDISNKHGMDIRTFPQNID